MSAFSFWQWLIVLLVVLVLFGGRGKIASVMSDIAKGLRTFKKEIDKDNTSEDDDKNNK